MYRSALPIVWSSFRNSKEAAVSVAPGSLQAFRQTGPLDGFGMAGESAGGKGGVLVRTACSRSSRMPCGWLSASAAAPSGWA